MGIEKTYKENAMSKRVLVPIAEGFEEIEALTVVDILRRAGANVVVAGVGGLPHVVGRSQVSVIPDEDIETALAKAPYDMIVLPGGLPNAHILRDHARLSNAVKQHADTGAYVGAICAAPLALERFGVLKGKPHTSHPGVRDQLTTDGYCDDRVVVAGKVLTSRAPGTAMEFAFAIVRELYGNEKAEEVNQGVLAVM
jgi:4-methyl-5(b-hydroxyethyl)-thiazole monophosphate biosynthesis